MDGVFTVGSLRHAMDDMRLERCGLENSWNKYVPAKVRILERLELGQLVL